MSIVSRMSALVFLRRFCWFLSCWCDCWVWHVAVTICLFGFGFGVARVQLDRRRLADSLQRRLTNGLESTQAFDILCLFPNSSHYLMLDSILVTLALIRTCILLITIVSVLVSCSSPSYPHVYPAHHHRIRTCILLIVVSPYSSAV